MHGIRALARAFKSHPVSCDDPVNGRSSTEFEVGNWAISEFVMYKLVPLVGKHPFPLMDAGLASLG